ncbi:hypothetical protein [Lentilactobacillus hilgardii]
MTTKSVSISVLMLKPGHFLFTSNIKIRWRLFEFRMSDANF